MVCFFLNSCNGLFEKDNTPTPFPLVTFRPNTQVFSLWHTTAGSGVGREFLRLRPAITAQAVFTANVDGTVVATDKFRGRHLWTTPTGVKITGGASVVDNLVLVGSQDGDLVGLCQANGQIIWRGKASSEILAPLAGGSNKILAKSIDGRLTAYSQYDGTPLWKFTQTEPTLILRGGSAPQVVGNKVIAGFANGNLANINLFTGNEYWQRTLAISEGCFAVQRMIDIDADPIIVNNRIYAATYQGKISAIDLNTGRLIWSNTISSYTGIAADSERVYVSDAESHVWAFDAMTGQVLWQQTQLQSRNITGPAIMGRYIVVGDQEGYLHWLNKTNGCFAARVRVSSGAILAAPVVDICNTLFVVTQNGHLASYKLY